MYFLQGANVRLMGFNNPWLTSKRADISHLSENALKLEEKERQVSIKTSLEYTNLNSNSRSSAQISAPASSFESLQNSDESVKVVFEDTQSKKLVSVDLSKQNYERLKNAFSSADNYHLREDGAVRLNGEAAGFVAGWFMNAAYDLNLLNADLNDSGALEGSELQNSFEYRSDAAKIAANEVRFSTASKSLYSAEQSRDIKGVLNELISQDNDLSGDISIAEMMDEGALKTLVKAAEAKAQSTDSAQNTSKAKKETDEDVLEKALEKGITALDASELVKLQQKYPAKYEALRTKELEKLSLNFKQDFQKQIFNESFELLSLSV